MFDALDLVVQPGDRLALVGRNGSGKSTLMRLMAGLVEPDRGLRTVAPATEVGYLEQEPDLSGHATLGDWAAAGLPPGEDYRVLAAAEGLGFDPGRPVATASGGERRRAALARLWAREPDLLLLDEPTNHLDIAAIRWLEARLGETRAAFILISHDRAFLRALTRATLWIDRGAVRRQDRGFEAFEAWRDKVWEEEDVQRHKLERRIKAEGRWAVEGISARRKRNQGRLRTLAAMRQERADQIRRQGTAELALESGPQSGRRVIELHDASKAWDGQTVVAPLSLRVMRGDRVAVVGANGAGKTTLLKLMTGELAPDAGSVTLGTNIAMAVFDQNRAALDPEATLWETLTGSEGLAVSGRADQVMVRGTPRHVVGYLKDFLFDETQARAPVRSLSGGEKARLLLAKLMAQPANLLVLDEPTNDLDVETLDLLEELLAEFDGTILLVTHDRDFLDRVASVTVAMAPGGRATVFAGGWSEAVEAAVFPPAEPPRPAPRPAPRAAPKPDRKPEPGPEPRPKGLSFSERHRLAALPDEIGRLEAEIGKLSAFLSDAAVYRDAPDRAAKATASLAERQAALTRAEEEWLRLAEREG